MLNFHNIKIISSWLIEVNERNRNNRLVSKRSRSPLRQCAGILQIPHLHSRYINNRWHIDSQIHWRRGNFIKRRKPSNNIRTVASWKCWAPRNTLPGNWFLMIFELDDPTPPSCTHTFHSPSIYINTYRPTEMAIITQHH